MVIMGKTSEEIKNGLEHCCEAGCKHCPYEDDCHLSDGGSELAADALAYIRQLEAQVPKWISTKERLPETGDVVLVIANANPRPNVELRNAYLIASYWADEGWIADGFEGWDALDVSYWMHLPEEPWR